MSQDSGLLWWGTRLAFCATMVFGLRPNVAEASSTNSEKKARGGVEASMKREHFFGRLRIELRKKLCEEGGLTDCFEVSKSNCEDFVTGHFEGCSKKLKTGERISLVGEDLVIAENVSICLSDRFSQKFKNKLKESNECKIRKNQ